MNTHRSTAGDLELGLGCYQRRLGGEKRNEPFLETVHFFIAAHLVYERETSQVCQEVLMLLILLSTLRTQNLSAKRPDTNIWITVPSSCRAYLGTVHKKHPIVSR